MRKALGFIFVCLAVIIFVARISIVLPFDLPFALVQTQSFNVNVHDVSRVVDFNISPELYNYYSAKELGDAVVHLKNVATGENDRFVFTSASVGQTFDSQVVLTVNSALMGTRAWQMTIEFNPSLVMVEQWDFGSSIFGSQATVPVSDIDNNAGEISVGEVAYEYACSIQPSSYVLFTVKWKIKAFGSGQFKWVMQDAAGHDVSMFIPDPEESWIFKNVKWYNAAFQFGSGMGINLGQVPEVKTCNLWITPKVWEPFCNSLKQVYPDDEDFVNAILQIVEQQTYDHSGPHYPIVTMGRKWGDCDTWSITVASFLKAANIKCVLVTYMWGMSGHMNLAVQLSHPPHDCKRSSPFGFNINGVQYWMAECTGQGSQLGWRVGEIPSDDLRSYSAVTFTDTVDTSTPPYALAFSIKSGGLTPYILTMQSSDGGATDPAAGVYTYSAGTQLSITARPDTANGWTFKYWLVDNANQVSQNPYTITMSDHHVVRPAFEKGEAGNAVITFTATLNGKPLEGAKVEITYTGKVQTKNTDASGSASFTVPESAGTVHAVVTYGQDSHHFDVQLNQDQITVSATFNQGSGGRTLDYKWLSSSLGICGIIMIAIPSTKKVRES
jgi:hypothetical protein